MTTSLIDCDIIAYRVAASCEKRDKEGNLLSLEPQDIAIARTDKQMREILEATGASTYKGFLSGENNFRLEIDPQYKANRLLVVKPTWLQMLREFLVVEWKASVTNGYEADDALGIAQTEESVICSIDKDLLQVPGKHYQWEISGNVKGKPWVREAIWYDIDPIMAYRNFYGSSLIGDTADNIVGVSGIGPVRAAKHLELGDTPRSMFDICRTLYADDQRYFRNLKLLWVLREEGKIFDETELLNAMD